MILATVILSLSTISSLPPLRDGLEDNMLGNKGPSWL